MTVRSIIIGLLFLESALLATAQLTLADRSVTLTFVDPKDLSPVDFTTPNVALVSVSATISGDGNTYTLLEDNGIVPDSEAFTLVYDLNPGLKDVKTLTEGASLQVPKIAGEIELQQLKAKHYLAKLSIDPEIRDQLNASILNLQEAVPSAGKVSSIDALKQLTTLAKWYAQIEKSYRHRTGPPLRRATLQQLSGEAAALNSLLRSALQSNRKLSNDDETQIAAIYHDLEMEMRAYGQVLANEAPKAEELCDVIVNIKGGDPDLVGALRVYYTFNGLYREPPVDPPVTSNGFPQLGSGKRVRLLAAKNYKVWAARDGDAGHPLTPPLRLETPASATGPVTVDLGVMSSKH